jgi:hypothetical protein
VSTDDRQEPTPGDGATRFYRRWPIKAWSVTCLAVLLVVFALNAPNELDRLAPAAFVRIPVEGLVAVALVLVLPGRPRRVVALLAGTVLGLLTILKVVDMGFYAVLDRPFDLVADWSLLDAAWTFVMESYGQLGALVAVLGATALATTVLVAMIRSVSHLAGLVPKHRMWTMRGTAVLGVAAVAFAVLGVPAMPEVPVAPLTYDHLLRAYASFEDRRAFAEAIEDDSFRDIPGDELLTALRGKDVILAFVESYGRDVVEEAEFADFATALDAGTGRLRAAGFDSRSAFLTSPTAGGVSWLAHATLLSGLWINNQQRYDTLVNSDRLTLGSAFRRAGWRTAGVMPGVRFEWPQGSSFFGYDMIYGAKNVGYRGPKFRWASMPDQYALSVFQRSERAQPVRAPVMAEVSLVSSHVPWTPIPRLIGWGEVGDGSIFNTDAGVADSPPVEWSDHTTVRTVYERAIEYSLDTLISYVETYGDEDLVLIVLGDHQPGPVITGAGASRDVPISIVAGDPAVLEPISGWGWADGLRPGAHAPVWRMDAFRDEFLTAFGPPAAPPSPGAPAR